MALYLTMSLKIIINKKIKMYVNFVTDVFNYKNIF